MGTPDDPQTKPSVAFFYAAMGYHSWIFRCSALNQGYHGRPGAVIPRWRLRLQLSYLRPCLEFNRRPCSTSHLLRIHELSVLCRGLTWACTSFIYHDSIAMATVLARHSPALIGCPYHTDATYAGKYGQRNRW